MRGGILVFIPNFIIRGIKCGSWDREQAGNRQLVNNIKAQCFSGWVRYRCIVCWWAVTCHQWNVKIHNCLSKLNESLTESKKGRIFLTLLLLFWRSLLGRNPPGEKRSSVLNHCALLLVGSSSDDGVLPPDTGGPHRWPPQEGWCLALHWRAGRTPVEGLRHFKKATVNLWLNE